jgi:hypothetical protein
MKQNKHGDTIDRAENTIDLAHISRFMETVSCLICFKKANHDLMMSVFLLWTRSKVDKPKTMF